MPGDFSQENFKLEKGAYFDKDLTIIKFDEEDIRKQKAMQKFREENDK
jgi:hypothetical protein